MHIESVTLKNFRSFGPISRRVDLGSEITALIGANGAGKSAFIEALRRLFGITQAERTVMQSDVHFGPNETPDSAKPRWVVIDVVFAFPELNGDQSNAERTVPQVFHSMTAAGPGEPLKARIRLEAKWVHGESHMDEVETKTYWVTTMEDVEVGDEGISMLDKQPLSMADRRRIQLVHVPATRDGVAVTRTALKQLLQKLERSGEFDAVTEQEFKEASEVVQEKVDALPAISWIKEKLTENWARLHQEVHLSNPRLVVLSRELTELLRSLTPELSPSPDGRAWQLQDLSEGQTSLFFLALAATLAQLEQELESGKPPEGFTDADVRATALTIYAIEEPENHLAPFYLSRLMELLGNLCGGNQAMGVLTSHSPGAIRRLTPEQVRHFRLERPKLRSNVRSIKLPNSRYKAAKFVREAVISQPEIYFANLVILGEGDSEAIVIPRIARALGVDLDPAFVSFAPLGGRHVNHFWKLLDQLKIPFLTLLDLDLGRYRAGPLRFKYAVTQRLMISGVNKPDWFSGDEKDTKYWTQINAAELGKWRDWLKDQGVFFSTPLDLDLMMIQSFPDAYDVKEQAGEIDPDQLCRSVFGKGKGLQVYKRPFTPGGKPSVEELAAYDRAFKKRGKPGSHIKALSALTDNELRKSCPYPLRDLITAADHVLKN